jgi:hypothetical protein
MATSELVVDPSTRRLEPGVAVAGWAPDTVLPSDALKGETLPLFSSSTVKVEIHPVEELPAARPDRVLFAAIRDPRLRIVQSIPLEVSTEDQNVVVHWADVDEFGTGSTLSEALDDFEVSARELYRQLAAPDVNLGPDMQRVKGVMEQHIQPRK